jgi:hypothetical protein
MSKINSAPPKIIKPVQEDLKIIIDDKREPNLELHKKVNSSPRFKSLRRTLH